MRYLTAYFLILGVFHVVDSAIIQPKLFQAVKENPGVTVIVELKRDTSTRIFNHQNEEDHQSRASWIKSLKDEATKETDSMLEPVNVILNSSESRRLTNIDENLFKIDVFPISKTIAIEGATKELLDILGQMETVTSIRESRVLSLPKIELLESDSHATIPKVIQWSLDKIKITGAWRYNLGEGVIVGSIDSGVLGEHLLLNKSYVGKYGWHDPYGKYDTPNDDVGHGTHTMGTIVGGDGFGVAPGAKWMACRACENGSCTEKALIECGEFMACPDPDCKFTPHIVSNSWGMSHDQTWFDNIIEFWHKAKIIPVFSNGNYGDRQKLKIQGNNECGSTASPAINAKVISVGSTDWKDQISPFSSVGTNSVGLIKPDIAAPGELIKSTFIRSLIDTATLSGTSMACPHVAGVIALMLSKNPDLKFKEIYQILMGTAKKESLKQYESCNGSETFPNNWYGNGRLNAHAALEAVSYPVTEAPLPDCKVLFRTLCTPMAECGWDEDGKCSPRSR